MENGRYGNARCRKAGYGMSFVAVPVFLVTISILTLRPGRLFGRAEHGNLAGPGRQAPVIQDARDHDMNQVFLRINNNAVIGLDITTGNGTGFWPKDTGNNYVFGSGLWFGGKADFDGDGDLDKIFVQGYNPLAGDSEFDPGRPDQDPEDPLARIYDSNDPMDLAEWPEEFRDPDSRDPIVHSPQDFVTIYKDVTHIPVFGASNLGIEVRQRSMAFMHDLSLNMIYFEWDLTNVSENMEHGPYAFEDAWIGYDIDADVGANFSDDMSSFFRDMVTPEGDTLTLDAAIVWDSDFIEANFTGTPGFLGLAYLQTPGNDADGIDNDGDGLVDESPFNGIDDDGDGDIDETDEVDEIGLVNYSRHCSPSQPCEVIDPQTDDYGYDIMSCISEANPDSSSAVNCMESTTPADIRFMTSSGPFDWRPGETIHTRFAFVFAQAIGAPSRLDFVGDPPRPDPNDPVLENFISTVLEARRFSRSGYTDFGVLPSLHNLTNLLPVNIPLFDFPVSISIFDTVGIARASVFYSIDTSPFEEIDLVYSENNQWDAEIPGPAFDSHVDFYYEVVDSLYRVAREPEDAPQTSFGYDVVRLPDFTDVTEEAGIGGGYWSQSWIALADYDDDGDQDAYLANSNPYSGSDLYRNEGDGTFTDVTGTSGIGSIEATCAAWADYDNDGHLDLFVTDSDVTTNRLFHANGDGTFTDVAQEAGVYGPGKTRSFAWGDYDNDGYVDLYLSRQSQYASERNVLFRNNGDGTFTDVAWQVGLDFAWIEAYPSYRVVIWVDADNDGWQDLYLTSPATQNSRLYRNNHDDTFTDISGSSDLRQVYSNQVVFSDYDNDGDPDLMTGAGSSSYGVNGIYRNEGDGRFTDITESLVFDGGVFHDVNNTGLLDVVAPLGWNSSVFYLNRGSEFVEVTNLFGSDPFPNYGYPLSFDYDGDGDLDIMTFNNGRILYRNEGFAPGFAGNWLHVKCVGTTSNRAALGAKVRATTGDLTRMRVVGGDRGNAQETLLAEFGLGEFTQVDRLVVEWPSGKIQELANVAVNRVITIVEDSTLVGIGDGNGSGPASEAIPKAFALLQNFPNPFNPSTTIGYDIPAVNEGAGAREPGSGSGIETSGEVTVPVRLFIYDIRGRLVKRLVDRESIPGRYQVHWDGRDGRGQSVASGVYFYRIEAGEFTSMRKMVMLR